MCTLSPFFATHMLQSWLCETTFEEEWRKRKYFLYDPSVLNLLLTQEDFGNYVSLLPYTQKADFCLSHLVINHFWNPKKFVKTQNFHLIYHPFGIEYEI